MGPSHREYHLSVPRLLAFIPHPDDESYSFGGLLALAAAAGWDCHVHCASSGEKGKRHDGGDTSREAVRETREHELAESCRLLGVRAPEFWRLPDGGLRDYGSRRAPVNAYLQELAPDVVLTLGADGAYGHPDHTTLHRWVVGQWWAYPRSNAALLFPVFPKGLFIPQWEKVRAKLGDPPAPPAEEIGSDEWQYEVDISSVREAKLASIAAHKSQLPGGDPEAIFPPGIVSRLLDVERFEDAARRAQPQVTELLAKLSTAKPSGN